MDANLKSQAGVCVRQCALSVQNCYSWLQVEYASWHKVDNVHKKLSGTDCVEMQMYLDNPLKQMELFYSTLTT
eukprot:1460308-Rhodomonas_salina.1